METRARQPPSTVPQPVAIRLWENGNLHPYAHCGIVLHLVAIRLWENGNGNELRSSPHTRRVSGCNKTLGEWKHHRGEQYEVHQTHGCNKTLGEWKQTEAISMRYEWYPVAIRLWENGNVFAAFLGGLGKDVAIRLWENGNASPVRFNSPRVLCCNKTLGEWKQPIQPRNPAETYFVAIRLWENGNAGGNHHRTSTQSHVAIRLWENGNLEDLTTNEFGLILVAIRLWENGNNSFLKFDPTTLCCNKTLGEWKPITILSFSSGDNSVAIRLWENGNRQELRRGHGPHPGCNKTLGEWKLLGLLGMLVM